MTPIITVPVATTTLSTVAGWSGPLFDFIFPIILIVVGLVVGSLVLGFIMRGITGAAGRVLARRGKRRRR